MPVPTIEMVMPLRVSRALKVSSLRVRDGVGVRALPRTIPLIDAPADADEGPIDDREASPPHPAARSPTAASTAIPAVERIRYIQSSRCGKSARSGRQLIYPPRDGCG